MSLGRYSSRLWRAFMKLVLEIQTLGHRAVGIGRHKGKVVMVPFAAAGDKLEVEIVSSHKSYDEARILRVLEPSSQRRDPPCPYFGSCGGCQLQHLEIGFQRLHKEQLLREMLRRQAGLDEDRVLPIQAGSMELGYRSRLDLQLLPGNPPRLGFASWGSSRLIPVKRCLLAMETLNQFLGELRELLAVCSRFNIRRVELACDSSGPGKTLLLSASAPLPRQTYKAMVEAAARIQGLRSVCLGRGRGGRIETLWKAPELSLGVLIPFPGEGKEGLSLEAWPGVFSQVNPQVNEILVQVLTSWVGDLRPRNALDLYAGMGNLSLTLAGLVEHVTAVEVDRRAVANGIANSLSLGIQNITWIRAEASRELHRMLSSGQKFDLVLLDPPRSGARELLEALLTLKPRAILYVSCDPATLARDLSHLNSKGGYILERIQPLDMFPQTFHLESISLLLAQGSVA